MARTRSQSTSQGENFINEETIHRGVKRDVEEGQQPEDSPLSKKLKRKNGGGEHESRATKLKNSPSPTKKSRSAQPERKGTLEGKDVYTTGVIERGHIYFFYRPKVQLEEAHSIDDVKNLHMLLVPRPPKFSTYENTADKIDHEGDEDASMQLLAAGADAVPASEVLGDSNKHYRLITIGKKHLPDPESGGVGKGRKQTFWATVTSVGDHLHGLEQGLGERTYETKTRGTRHEEPARLAARGAYAIVNNNPETPSKRATHFGYHISHPSDIGDVQKELGIGKVASFVLQVKNPLAPATGPRQVHSKGAQYPEYIMLDVFGKGGEKGRQSYGLRFAACEMPELMDYSGAELLLIAANGDEAGLNASLGEGRGTALCELEDEESKETVEILFRELDVDAANFPTEPLEGHWI